MTQIIRNPVLFKQPVQTPSQNPNKYPQIHGKLLNILKYIFHSFSVMFLTSLSRISPSSWKQRAATVIILKAGEPLNGEISG